MKILVATDGSQSANRAAEFVAGFARPGAEVRVLTTVSLEHYPHSLVGEHDLSDSKQREIAVRDRVARDTAFACRVLSAAGHNVITVHRFGVAAEEILDEAQVWGAEMIVLGHRGVSGLSKWLTGVSEKVLHQAAVPTLLVPHAA